jgi:hypothetical protein
MDKELKAACELVGKHARRIGKDCQIIFADVGVEVAPLSWAGSEVKPKLFQAINAAMKSRDEQ